jgi:hypothetical protein
VGRIETEGWKKGIIDIMKNGKDSAEQHEKKRDKCSSAALDEHTTRLSVEAGVDSISQALEWCR